jgi:hypothetical protein
MPDKPHTGNTALPVVGVAVAAVAFFLLFGMGGLFAVVLVALFWWMLRDAKKTTEAHKGRRQVKPGPDGDMSDVAGVTKREPWLG